MYTPDRTFVKDLKRLDKYLNCYYNQDHGHFVVTYQRPAGKPAEILLVEDSTGGFRQPDRREIDCLGEGDLCREDAKTRLQKGAAYMEKHREKQEKEVRDSMHDATVDDKIQLKNTISKMTNTGSKSPEHRRIIPKPKGTIF